MTEKSSEENQVPEFKRIIANYTDEELRKVLKKRKLYQNDAAEFAIEEAIKRGLIFSEQDLFAREFQHEPEKFILFPAIENEKARKKFMKSIARSLIILGALPMILGGIKIFETQSLEGILIFIFGALWSFISFQLMRSVKLNHIILMYFLLVIAIGYVVKIFVSAGYVKIADILIAAVAVGFVAYGIGFLNKLKD
jgi:hypothetical protein